MSYNSLRPEMTWHLLARQTDIGQSKSSVLNPLQWTLAILLLGLLGAFETRAPGWFTIGIGVCIFAVFALLISAYVYFMVKAPDALRSEGFSLQKLAIEKGLLGDSLQGLRTIDATSTNIVLKSRPGGTDEQEQQGQ